jgi:transketolase
MTNFNKAIKEAKASMMPFESWERLADESSNAFKAFCAFRDFGAERSIKKVVDTTEQDENVRTKNYRKWYNWSSQYRWNERAADFDRYIEKLKQTELRKTIEVQAQKHRDATGKMLDVVIKKLDIMNPEELTQGNVKEWVETAIKAERTAAGLVTVDGTALR